MTTEKRLGCPQCDNETNLMSVWLGYEPIIVFSDGGFEHPEHHDYGPIIAIECGECGWSSADFKLKRVHPGEALIEAHKQRIIEQLRKEAQT